MSDTLEADAPAADAAAPPADAPQESAPHDDWIRSVLGFDPGGAANAPATMGDADAGDAGAPDTRPDADGDGPSGAPGGSDAAGSEPAPTAVDEAIAAGATNSLTSDIGDAWDKATSAIKDKLKSLWGDDPVPAQPAAPQLPPEDQAVKDASGKVSSMNEADLQKLNPDDRLKLMQQLQSKDPLSDEAKAAQKKLYENTPLDPKMQAVDDARNDKLVQDMQSDKELQEARRNWGSMTPDQRAAAVKKVVAAQSKAMGMDPPEIVLDKGTTEGGLVVSGVYNKDDGKLHLNSDPTSDLNASLDKAVAIAAHENTHKYQYQLIQKLDSGQLQPGDPEYDQARLLKANDAKNGYVDPSTANEKAYRNQPFEQQAYHNGDKVGKSLNKGLYNTSGDWAFDGRPGPLP